MSSRWPDFLLLGAPKAGTTALYAALAKHPQLWLSEKKEPRYFAYPGRRPVFTSPIAEHMAASIVSDSREYLALFADCPPELRAGEASTAYLHHPDAPVNAKAEIPGARLIAVLRQPVDRAYSQWLHFRQHGIEPIGDFEKAWHAGKKRQAEGWAPTWLYRERGFYAEQLERWLACFPHEQLLVLYYEDWLEKPAQVLSQICAHLEVKDFKQPTVTRENVSSRQPRWKWLHYRMTGHNALRDWAQRRLPLWVRDAITRPVLLFNTRPGPPIDPALRARLSREYREDLEKLEAMTGRNLEHWKDPALK